MGGGGERREGRREKWEGRKEGTRQTGEAMGMRKKNRVMIDLPGAEHTAGKCSESLPKLLQSSEWLTLADCLLKSVNGISYSGWLLIICHMASYSRM